MKKVKRFKSIQSRMVFYFIAVFLVVSFVSTVIQYKNNSDKQFEKSRDEIKRIAAAAALAIDGDMHVKIENRQDKNGEIYKKTRAKMQEFMKETEIWAIYTLVENGDKTKFIIDADENPTEIGYEYKYLDSMRPAFEGTSNSEEKLSKDKWGTVISGYAPIKNSKDEVVAIIGVDIDADYINKQKRELLVIATIINGVGLIVMAIISIILARKISKPITKLVDSFNELSLSKDLNKNIEIKTGDELEILSDSINEFIASFRDTIVEIQATGENVSSSANVLSISIKENQTALDEVSRAIENIAVGATDQAKDVNDVSYGIQEIVKDVDENKKKVNSINNAAGETRKLINYGLEAVNNQNDKTNENIEAFEKVTDVVKTLADEIENIEKILSKITGISEQTNLLALNAAIEAARAGELGKGFSVVADEVRILAEESSVATEEISYILEKININVKDAVEQINTANTIAKEQKHSVESTSMTFKDITNEVESIIDSISLINESFEAIGDNTNKISNNIQDVSSISQGNAAISEEVSASSEEQNSVMYEIGATAETLNELSKNLKDVISKFKI